MVTITVSKHVCGPPVVALRMAGQPTIKSVCFDKEMAKKRKELVFLFYCHRVCNPGKLTLNGFGVKFDPEVTFPSVHTRRGQSILLAESRKSLKK